MVFAIPIIPWNGYSLHQLRIINMSGMGNMIFMLWPSQYCDKGHKGSDRFVKADLSHIRVTFSAILKRFIVKQGEINVHKRIGKKRKMAHRLIQWRHYGQVDFILNSNAKSHCPFQRQIEDWRHLNRHTVKVDVCV